MAIGSVEDDYLERPALLRLGESDLVHYGEEAGERQVTDVDYLRDAVREDQPVEQPHSRPRTVEIGIGCQLRQLVGKRRVARGELKRLDRAAMHAQEIDDKARQKGLAVGR